MAWSVESGSEEFRYTGKPEDSASGLYYYRARFYDPLSYSTSMPEIRSRLFSPNNPSKME